MAQLDQLMDRHEENQAVDTRSVGEIRQDIATMRQSIAETIDKIGDRVVENLDWRRNVAKHPLLALGAAAGMGFLCSALLRPRPNARERLIDALADSVEEINDRLDDHGLRRSNGFGRLIKAAAMATVTRAATDYLSRRVNAHHSAEPVIRR